MQFETLFATGLIISAFVLLSFALLSQLCTPGCEHSASI